MNQVLVVGVFFPPKLKRIELNRLHSFILGNFMTTYRREHFYIKYNSGDLSREFSMLSADVHWDTFQHLLFLTKNKHQWKLNGRKTPCKLK